MTNTRANTSKKTNTETNIIDYRHIIASCSDQGWTNCRQGKKKGKDKYKYKDKDQDKDK